VISVLKGEEAIEMMLLTSIPVENVDTAQAIVEWYRGRGVIEIYFRVLKQGCQIERLRLETDPRHS
jgi:transposase